MIYSDTPFVMNTRPMVTMPFTRAGYRSFVTFDGTYYRAYIVSYGIGESATMLFANNVCDGTPLASGGTATYQWKGYFDDPFDGVVTAFWGLCREPGAVSYGAIGFYLDNGLIESTLTAWEQPNIQSVAGTWTTEKTFKFTWATNNVNFYVDDVLVKTHTTRVPPITTKLPFVFEVSAGPVTPAAYSRAYLKARSFEQIA